MDFFYENFAHVLCALLFISRVGDVLSTYLVTPNLKLEANPIVRKLGWKYALLTILVCFIPYYSLVMAVFALPVFLLVCASNFKKVWVARTMGEEGLLNHTQELIKKAKLSDVMLSTLASSFFLFLTGLSLYFLSPYGPRQWSYWFAMGIMAYAFVTAFYGCLFYGQLFRKMRRN